jgi:hypothetical protein
MVMNIGAVVATLVTCLSLLVVSPVAAPFADAAPAPDRSGAQAGAPDARAGKAADDGASAAPGALSQRQQERILGLPANAALLLGGVLVVAAVVVPGARRRSEARGGGTYGRD